MSVYKRRLKICFPGCSTLEQQRVQSLSIPTLVTNGKKKAEVEEKGRAYVQREIVTDSVK